jgi:energy-coupling factor transporter ATP-binding protein EcfA2
VLPNALEVVDLSYRYPGTESEALSDVSLFLKTGECVCLTGPSGCGKSTLLLAMAGLLKGGELKGRCTMAASGRVPAGIVFQNAESQILSTTVGDEVAFGPMNLGVPREERTRRVRTALQAVGLSGYETRNVDELSAGEKHRLTLASVLSMEPQVFLLDEPTAQLDAKGKEGLRAILQGLKERRYTIVVADHDVRPYEGIAERFLFMNDGRIEKGDSKGRAPWEVNPACSVDKGARLPPSGGRPLIVLDRASFAHAKDRSVLSGLSLEVRAGERVHILGDNGAGKSTLLKIITGLLRPDSGSMDVLGQTHPRPERLKGKVGLLLQNPVRQIFESTIYEEVAFSLKRQGLSAAETEGRTANALALCDLSAFRDRSPFNLSYGEQHRVTLASVIAVEPRVLLLDEPFSGLDFRFRRKVLDILGRFAEQSGCAIVVTSHDPLIDPCWADRPFLLHDGRLTQGGA